MGEQWTCLQVVFVVSSARTSDTVLRRLLLLAATSHLFRIGISLCRLSLPLSTVKVQHRKTYQLLRSGAS